MLLEWGVHLYLFPQRFVLPVGRESHSCHINVWMLLQQIFQLVAKVVAGTHDVLNVLQTTKLWV